MSRKATSLTFPRSTLDAQESVASSRTCSDSRMNCVKTRLILRYNIKSFSTKYVYNWSYNKEYHGIFRSSLLYKSVCSLCLKSGVTHNALLRIMGIKYG